MKFKILFFMIPFLAVFFLSSQNVSADVKLCSSDAECGANAGCLTGACLCNPQYYNCDANFANGCEKQYSCSNTCTAVNQKYCYSNNVWNAYQASDCGVGSGLFQTCSSPTPKCYQSGSSASCVECLSNADCTDMTKPNCDLSTHTCKAAFVPSCNNNLIQDNGETGIDCGGGGCADCSVPVCTSCSADGTAVGACNSAGQRCSIVGGVCSLYTDASCAASACSGWGNMGDCNGDYNCKWCSGASSCVDYDAACFIADNCPAQTSKSACDQQTGGSTSYACGWCPNSYSGGTSANGGTCMKAENLASQCGGCYNTGAYNTIGNQCFGKCPIDSGTKGYYGGWCIWAGQEGVACDYIFNYATTCSCKGNKFDTAKSSDNIVNCGECAINADGQNCGGTAVTGTTTYNGQTYTGNEGANVYGGASVSSYNTLFINNPAYQEQSYSWCAEGGQSAVRNCVIGGGYKVPCRITGKGPCKTSSIIAPSLNEIPCGETWYQSSCYSGCGQSYVLNTCIIGDTCSVEGNYNNRGKCCPAGYPYYNSADSKCYQEYKPPCSDSTDNDRDCLVDCADTDCSATAACAGKAAKQSCNAPGNPNGPCGSCAGVTYNGQPTTCVSGVCEPVCTPSWTCETPLNGYESDGCSHTRASSACIDNPPSVTAICSPASATADDTVTVSATATDDKGLAQINLYVDGGTLGLGIWPTKACAVSGTSAACQYSAKYAAGTHSVYATATDTKPQTAQSTGVCNIAAPFDFSLACSSGMSVAQGGSASTTVTAALASGSSQPVSLSVSGMPPGSNIILSPSSVNPSGSSSAAITYRATICDECYWELAFTGDPQDSNKLVLSGMGITNKIARSTDGGRTWNTNTVDSITDYPVIGVVNKGDPKLLSSNGKLFLSSLYKRTSDQKIGGVLYQGGFSGKLDASLWQDISTNNPNQYSTDRESMQFDPATSSTIYIVSQQTWFEDTQSYGTGLFISNDGGKTFQKKKLSPNSMMFMSMAVSDGVLYVVGIPPALQITPIPFYRVDLTNLNNINPTMLTFPGDRVLSGLQIAKITSDIDKYMVVYTGPEIIADTNQQSPHKGRLYLVWMQAEEYRQEVGEIYGYNDDILVSYSDDKGNTWSSPVRANDDVGKADQFFPSAKLDPNGKLHIAFVDRRNTQDQAAFDVYYTSSSDGGITFSQNLRITDSPVPIPTDRSDGRVIGDYLDMVMPYSDKVYIAYPCGSQTLAGVNYPKSACMVEFTNPTAAGPASTLTVYTASSTPPGSYALSIKGTTSGGKTRTVNCAGLITVTDVLSPDMYCANTNYFSVTPASPSDYDKISVYAAATDNVGVSRIDILADGIIVKTCSAYAGTASPCSTMLGSYSAGTSHTITARAYDAAGNKKDCSKTITVVSQPADCTAALKGQQCNVGSVGTRINCVECAQFICS